MLVDLGVLTSAALLISLLFARLGLPIVAGQVVAGMLVGPFGLNLLRDTQAVAEIASIGVVLLLFTIGLELDPFQLGRMAGKVVSLTALEMAMAASMAAPAALLLGLKPLEGMAFAMALAISSTAITAKAFISEGRLESPEGEALMGLLVVEDVAAVLFLTVLSSLSVRAGLPTAGLEVLRTLLGGIGLMLFAFAVARYVAPLAVDLISHLELELEEIPFLLSLGLALVFGALAALLGYSPGTGAFMIGLAIRGKRSRFLLQRVAAVKDLFLAVFFVSVGTLIGPPPSLYLMPALLLSLALACAGKALAGMAVGRLLGPPNGYGRKLSYFFARWLMPRGEFSLAIGQFAVALGIMGQGAFSMLGLVALGTILIWSYLVRRGQIRLAKAEHPVRPTADSLQAL